MARHFLTPRLILEQPVALGLRFSRYDSLTRRLRALEKAKLIRRQPCSFNREDSFYLTKEGGRLVELRVGELVPTQAVKPTTFSQQLHAFEVSRFSIKFLQDAAKLSMPIEVFYRDGSFLHYISTRKKLIPDAVVVLRIRGKSQVFCIELDRSTQSGATILEKYRRYELMIRCAKKHPKLQGRKLGNIRIVVVCQSQERLKHLVRLAESAPIRKYLRFIRADQVIEKVGRGYEPREWQYRKVNLFSSKLFVHAGRPPPSGML